MKKLGALLILAVLVSCNSNESAEEIRNKINEKEKKIQDLSLEINKLKKQLNEEDVDTARKAIPVKTETIQPEEFNHYFEASGVVEAVNEAFVSPEISGQIEEILVDEGDRVKRGQVLARLSKDVIDNNINEVKTQLDLARIMYDKQKRLWDKKIGSEVQYLEAKNRVESLESRLSTLQAQRNMAVVTAPINGIVDNIFKKKGELAVPGMQLMQIVNLDELYVNVDIAETYLPKVSKGDKVILEFPTYADMKMQVPIHRIGNVIEPDNRTFTLELKIENKDGIFKPNMVAIVKVNDFSADSAMVVPAIVLKQDLKGHYLYTVTGKPDNFEAEKSYVTPGLSYNDETMIKEGLNFGDRVVVSGYTQISDGSDVFLK